MEKLILTMKKTSLYICVLGHLPIVECSILIKILLITEKISKINHVFIKVNMIKIDIDTRITRKLIL